jgi:membrane protein
MFLSRNEATLHAAALAYYTIFSLAPLLIISTAIAASFVNEAAVEGKIVELFANTLGSDVALFIQDIIKSSYDATSTSLATVIGLGMLIYGASTIFYKMRFALNAMWGIVPKSTDIPINLLHIVKSRLLSATVVVGVGILLLGSLLLTAYLAALPDQLLARLFPNFEELSTVVSILGSPIVYMIVFAVIFETLPNAKIRWRDVWPGAALTAILFWIGGYFISLYLGRSGIASIYGASGALIVFLIWVYYSAWIFLFGAKFTQVYADRFGVPIRPDGNATFKYEPPPEEDEPSSEPFIIQQPTFDDKEMR